MDKLENLKYFKQLETPRLVLRKMQKSDAEDMYEYAKGQNVTEFLLWSPHPGVEYTRAYIASIQKYYRLGTYFDYAVILKSENRMIGTCGFTRIDRENNSAEVGYVINPAYQNKGYASEATLAVMRFGMCDLGFNRIEGRYMVRNAASRRVMEKCGMSFEGVHRNLMLVKGRYEDIGICAALRSDFVFRFGPDSANAVFSDVLGRLKRFDRGN